MSGRRERIIRAAALAAEAERRAEARWVHAAAEVVATDAQRQQQLDNASALARESLPARARSMLAHAGSARLEQLAELRRTREEAATVELDRLTDARVRTRALDKLADRLRTAAEEARRAAELAAHQDLIVSRAVHRMGRRRTSSPGGPDA
ncbi:MAG: hypothetical protein AAF467_25640 [Actinomycetota bacterium]